MARYSVLWPGGPGGLSEAGAGPCSPVLSPLSGGQTVWYGVITNHSSAAAAAMLTLLALTRNGRGIRVHGAGKKNRSF